MSRDLNQSEILDLVKARIISAQSELGGLYWFQDEITELLEGVEQIRDREQISNALEEIEIAYAVMSSEGRTSFNGEEIQQVRSVLNRLLELIEGEIQSLPES